jgi:hypothetical protein
LAQMASKKRVLNRNYWVMKIFLKLFCS